MQALKSSGFNPAVVEGLLLLFVRLFDQLLVDTDMLV